MGQFLYDSRRRGCPRFDQILRYRAHLSPFSLSGALKFAAEHNHHSVVKFLLQDAKDLMMAAAVEMKAKGMTKMGEEMIRKADALWDEKVLKMALDNARDTNIQKLLKEAMRN